MISKRDWLSIFFLPLIFFIPLQTLSSPYQFWKTCCTRCLICFKANSTMQIEHALLLFDLAGEVYCSTVHASHTKTFFSPTTQKVKVGQNSKKFICDKNTVGINKRILPTCALIIFRKKKFLGIEKVLITLSILKKNLSKIDGLMCIL